MDIDSPRHCHECGQKAVKPAVLPYHTKMKHENTLHDVFVPAMSARQCEACKALFLNEESDIAIRAALREKLQLLTPETIVACKNQLGVSQEKIAQLWGFAPESLSRWIGGALQSRSSDRMLRVFFGVPQAREFLERLELDSTAGSCVIWHVPSFYSAEALLGQGIAPQYVEALDSIQSSSPAAGTKPAVPTKAENGPEPPLYPPNVFSFFQPFPRTAFHERHHFKVRSFRQRCSHRQPG